MSSVGKWIKAGSFVKQNYDITVKVYELELDINFRIMVPTG